jgi:SNF family Na+-dependent transporter
MPKSSEPGRWSTQLAFHLAAVGAAVGLGSIWRFPYLTGANGGSAFVFVFVLACLAIATPWVLAYAWKLTTGDVTRGLTFAFAPSKLRRHRTD